MAGIANQPVARTNCRRELGRVFQLRHPDGSNRCLARKRLARATGGGRGEADPR